jgi:adenylyl-sulfate kinase
MSRLVTLWMTGLPCSGKSTISTLVFDGLVDAGVPATVLDGDTLRAGPCADLGFSREDRLEQSRRAAVAAQEQMDNGRVAIVATIAPYEAGRASAREILGDAYLEVHVDADEQTCESRDVKGHWARARAGAMEAFTGVSDPYERPENPHLRLDTATETPEDSARRVLALLAEHGVLDGAELGLARHD